MARRNKKILAGAVLKIGAQAANQNAAKEARKAAQPKERRSHGTPAAELIKSHMASGLGKVEISRMLGVPEGAVNYLMRKLGKNGGRALRQRGSGRKRAAPTPAFAASLASKIAKDSKAPTTALAKVCGRNAPLSATS